MPAVSHSAVTRWAVGNGGLTAPDGSAIDEAAALDAMPDIGLHEVQVGPDAYEVERVGSRYCTLDDMVDYGKENNDGFDDAERYSDARIWAAIQAAEEAIESCCGRSFCKRARDVELSEGFNELPEVDVSSISEGVLASDRQAIAEGPCTAEIVYGRRSSAAIRRACVKLAASYLRPRAGAENARGQSVDGVYISYELATGEDGSWTGLPEVDAAIALNKSNRRLIG